MFFGRSAPKQLKTRVNAEVPLRCIPSTSNACVAALRSACVFADFALSLARRLPSNRASVCLRDFMTILCCLPASWRLRPAGETGISAYIRKIFDFAFFPGLELAALADFRY